MTPPEATPVPISSKKEPANIYKYADMIDTKYLDERNDWRNIVWALSDFPAVATYLSRKSNKFKTDQEVLDLPKDKKLMALHWGRFTTIVKRVTPNNTEK